MSDWLHWIGRGMYTRTSFIKEASRYGVARRFPPQVLRAMNWGDKVFCIIREKLSDKSGVVFGYFIVDRITGVSQEVTKLLDEQGKIGACVRIGGISVVRRCGTYTTGPAFTVDASISEICDTVDEVEADNFPMVSGVFRAITPLARLLDVPFQQGARRFDGEQFTYDVDFGGLGLPEDGIMKLNGMYYVDQDGSDQGPKAGAGEVESVLKYQQERR